jgi:hypothetical protein
MIIVRIVPCIAATCLLAMLAPQALAQQAPPPPPKSATIVPQRTPGLSPELAEAAQMIRDGHYAPAPRSTACSRLTAKTRRRAF